MTLLFMVSISVLLGPWADFLVDVFTGGSVPSMLFTSECWDGIKAVLKSNGVLAVVSQVDALFGRR